MTSRIIAILSFLSILATNGFAQEDTTARHNRLSIDAGFARIANFDNVGSPLPYAASSVPLAFAYEHTNDTDRHTIEASFIASLFNAATLKNRYSSSADYRKAYFGYADIDYRYVHRTGKLFSTPLDFFLGGEWDNIGFLRRYSYDGEDIYGLEGSGSGELSSSLDIAADVCYAIDAEQSARFSISLPVVAYIARPPYGFDNGNVTVAGYPVIDARLSFIGSFINWKLRLEYQRELSPYFFGGIRLSNVYYWFPRFGWSSTTAENEASLFLAWRFSF